MGCQAKESGKVCGHHQCQFVQLTGHGYECVDVNQLGLCEVGEGCVPECPYSYTAARVQKCHVCNGDPDIETGCPNCGLFGIERKPKKYIGFQKDLPIKKGDIVTILKGTPVTYRGKTKPAGKSFTVKVDHTLCGMTRCASDIAYEQRHGRQGRDMNPTVVWAGTGGYWAEADINDIPEADPDLSFRNMEAK